MKKEFIPYELAVKLKELGFDEPCFGCYDEKCVFGLTVMSIKQYYTNSKEDTWNCAAPLYQQAFRWFREKHNLWIEVHVEDNVKLGEQKYYWRIFGEYTSYEENSWIRAKVDSNGVMSNTYEEAELACLNKLIELVTDEQTRTTG